MELDRMLELVSEPDPQLRRYALTQIEYLADSGDVEDVMEVLKHATVDPVAFVRHQADRTLQALLDRGLRAVSGEASPPADAGSFEGIPILDLQRVGHRLIAPLLASVRRLARGPEPGITSRCLIALGKARDPESFEIHCRALDDPDLARIAARTVRHVGRDRAVGPLLAAARHDDPAIRRHALAELGSFGDPQVLPILEENAQNPDPPVRASVAVALARHPDRDACLEALACLLDDGEVFVILEAVRSLARCPSARSVQACLRRYRSTGDDHVKAAILVTLGQLDLPGSQDLLVSALGDPNDRVRANAVEALGLLAGGRSDGLASVRPLAGDANNRVRANVALALAREEPDRSLEILQGMLASPDIWFRASGAWALGRLATADAVGLLVRVLSEEGEPQVLIPAMRALDTLEGPAVTEPLFKLLEHPSPGIRNRAARILGRTGGSGMVPQVKRKFERENDPTVRATLVTVLGRLADSRDLVYLVEVLQRETHARVQANAIEVLAERGSLGHLGQVRPFLSSPDNRVKANAAMALFDYGEFQVVQSLAAMLDPADRRQLYSAVFAVGEIGRLIGGLDRSTASLSLLHSLKNRSMSTSAMTARPPSSIPAPAMSDEEQLEESLEMAIHAMLTTDRDPPGPAFALVSARHPASALPRYLLARTAAAGGEEPGAYPDVLREVEEELRDFLGPCLELANRASQERDAAAMVEHFLEAYVRRLDQIQEQIAAIRSFLAAGSRSEAVFALKDLAKSTPIAGEAHHRMGKLYLSLKRYDRALRHLFLAHLETPGDVEVSYDYACAAYAQGRVSLAVTLCREVLAVGGDEGSFAQKARRMYSALKDKIVGGNVEGTGAS